MEEAVAKKHFAGAGVDAQNTISPASPGTTLATSPFFSNYPSLEPPPGENGSPQPANVEVPPTEPDQPSDQEPSKEDDRCGSRVERAHTPTDPQDHIPALGGCDANNCDHGSALAQQVLEAPAPPHCRVSLPAVVWNSAPAERGLGLDGTPAPCKGVPSSKRGRPPHRTLRSRAERCLGERLDGLEVDTHCPVPAIPSLLPVPQLQVAACVAALDSLYC